MPNDDIAQSLHALIQALELIDRNYQVQSSENQTEHINDDFWYPLRSEAIGLASRMTNIHSPESLVQARRLVLEIAHFEPRQGIGTSYGNRARVTRER